MNKNTLLAEVKSDIAWSDASKISAATGIGQVASMEIADRVWAENNPQPQVFKNREIKTIDDVFPPDEVEHLDEQAKMAQQAAGRQLYRTNYQLPEHVIDANDARDIKELESGIASQLDKDLRKQDRSADNFITGELGVTQSSEQKAQHVPMMKSDNDPDTNRGVASDLSGF